MSISSHKVVLTCRLETYRTQRNHTFLNQYLIIKSKSCAALPNDICTWLMRIKIYMLNLEK